MRYLFFFFCAIAFPLMTHAGPKAEQSQISFRGYDPVTYLKGEPVLGKEGLITKFEGKTYVFTTQRNRSLFLKNPTKYLPAFGGNCPYALLKGKKIEGDPRNYKVVNGKVLFFYRSFRYDARKVWEDEFSTTEAATLAEVQKIWDKNVWDQILGK